MLGKKNKEETQNGTTSMVNIIGAGTTINGKLNCGGDIRIDGKIDGDVIVASKLVLNKGAIITGNIVAGNADIAGTVTGNIEIKNTLHLLPSGKVNGDVTTNKLVVDPNAVLNGKCSMANTSTSKNHLSKSS